MVKGINIGRAVYHVEFVRGRQSLNGSEFPVLVDEDSHAIRVSDLTPLAEAFELVGQAVHELTRRHLRAVPVLPSEG